MVICGTGTVKHSREAVDAVVWLVNIHFESYDSACAETLSTISTKRTISTVLHGFDGIPDYWAIRLILSRIWRLLY